MKILFSSDEWNTYSPYLKKYMIKKKLNPNNLIKNVDDFHNDIKYIIYSPSSNLKNFNSFPNLSAILNLWAGVEKVVNNKTLNVPLIRLIDKNMTQSMVEWCITHVLRYHIESDNYVINKYNKWKINFLPNLSKNTNIGILGYGILGKAVGIQLSKLGFNVHGWSKNKKKPIKKTKLFYGDQGLKEMLPKVKILLILLPLTNETENLINYSNMELLQKNSYIINAGRGHIINDDDLLNMLKIGHIKHATLDVFRKEPLPKNHTFWRNPKITVSPHIAAVTRPKSSSKIIIKNILKLEKNMIPFGLVNTKKEY